jgi:hypothetical protein
MSAYILLLACTHYYLTLRNAIYIIKVIYVIFLHIEFFLDFFNMQTPIAIYIIKVIYVIFLHIELFLDFFNMQTYRHIYY